MRREERVTVQGPVKKQQRDGMSHGGGGCMWFGERSACVCRLTKAPPSAPSIIAVPLSPTLCPNTGLCPGERPPAIRPRCPPSGKGKADKGGKKRPETPADKGGKDKGGKKDKATLEREKEMEALQDKLQGLMDDAAARRREIEEMPPVTAANLTVWHRAVAWPRAHWGVGCREIPPPSRFWGAGGCVGRYTVHRHDVLRPTPQWERDGGGGHAGCVRAVRPRKEMRTTNRHPQMCVARVLPQPPGSMLSHMSHTACPAAL